MRAIYGPIQSYLRYFGGLHNGKTQTQKSYNLFSSAAISLSASEAHCLPTCECTNFARSLSHFQATCLCHCCCSDFQPTFVHLCCTVVTRPLLPAITLGRDLCRSPGIHEFNCRREGDVLLRNSCQLDSKGILSCLQALSNLSTFTRQSSTHKITHESHSRILIFLFINIKNM